MAIRVLVLNETDHWAENVAVRRLGGRIFGVYLYHDTVHVRCCEFTPSFELHRVEDAFALPDDVWNRLTNIEKEEISDEIVDGNRETPRISYMHTHIVEALPEHEVNLPRPTSLPSGKGCTFLLDDDREGFIQASNCSEEECDSLWMEASMESVAYNSILREKETQC